MTARFPIHSGLCSVTFRQMSAPDIIKLVRDAGLDAIEWGMDVHLTPGDLAQARALSVACKEAGILVPTVGSYLRADGAALPEFGAVLDSCLELGAKSIRVWAGTSGSAETAAEERALIVDRIREYCDRASVEGASISLEYHRNTLTDTLESASALLKQVGHDALTSYWQPRAAGPAKSAVLELDRLKAHLAHVHVFHWQDYNNRFALEDGRAFWAACFDKLASVPAAGGGDHFAFLEFVRDDDPDQFRRDAATLKSLLAT